MMIWVDTREKARAIVKILAEFDRQGVGHFPFALPVGDYMNLDNPRLIIDRKQSLSELYCNLCQDHKRFASELTRAQTVGIQLIILIEHGSNIKTIEDVKNWENPRLKVSPYAWDGLRMYKVMITVQGKYGVEWQFCTKAQTGKRIIEILKGE
jgi:ERCC4-type nuclease